MQALLDDANQFLRSLLSSLNLGDNPRPVFSS
jgi:hypothetical protein